MVQMGHNTLNQPFYGWREKQESLLLRLQFKLSFRLITQLEYHELLVQSGIDETSP